MKKAGVYPVTEGARLFDAIYIAGGITDEADINRVTIIHTHLRSPNKVEMDIKKYLVMGDLSQNPQLAEGDTVIVPVSADVKIVPEIQTAYAPSIRVSIIGEVTTMGAYRVSPDSSILDTTWKVMHVLEH